MIKRCRKFTVDDLSDLNEFEFEEFQEHADFCLFHAKQLHNYIIGIENLFRPILEKEGACDFINASVSKPSNFSFVSAFISLATNNRPKMVLKGLTAELVILLENLRRCYRSGTTYFNVRFDVRVIAVFVIFFIGILSFIYPNVFGVKRSLVINSSRGEFSQTYDENAKSVTIQIRVERIDPADASQRHVANTQPRLKTQNERALHVVGEKDVRDPFRRQNNNASVSVMNNPGNDSMLLNIMIPNSTQMNNAKFILSSDSILVGSCRPSDEQTPCVFKVEPKVKYDVQMEAENFKTEKVAIDENVKFKLISEISLPTVSTK